MIAVTSTQELIKDTSMTSATTISSSEPTKVHTSNISSIKAFVESNGASLIPSNYHSLTEPHDIIDVADELAASIPVVDFSLLTSEDPQIHTKAVHELAKACSEWGFFMVTFPFYLVVFSNDTSNLMSIFFFKFEKEKLLLLWLNMSLVLHNYQLLFSLP